MALLAGVNYDPSSSGSKATSALLAMTAMDTTNLRLNFTVPASGNVMVRIGVTMHGGTAPAMILLGVMEGSTVKGRKAPISNLVTSTGVATTLVACESVFLVTGLTPAASLTWDAAYSVETLGASSSIKYGGPNNATANDAFGGIVFEIWSVD